MSNTNSYQLTTLQRKYLSDLSKNLKKAKKYTPEQVNVMVQQYQVAPNAELLRELFISQSCLIYDQAKAFYKRISKDKWDLDDIVATANEIFIRMLDKYSDSRGSTFSSFIRNILPKYLLNEYKLVCGVIRTPVNKLSMILKHKKNLEVFVGKFGRMPYQGESLEIGGEEYTFDYRHTFYVEDDSSLPTNTDLVVQPSIGNESYAMFDEIRQRFGERIYQIVYLHLAEGRSFTEINTLLTPITEDEVKYLAKVNTVSLTFNENVYQVQYSPKAEYVEDVNLDKFKDGIIQTAAKKVTLTLGEHKKTVLLNPKGLYKKSTSIKSIYENTLKILRTEYA